MLRWRLAISLILIPLLAWVFYVDAQSGPAGAGLFVLCALLALRAVWELYELLKPRHPQLHAPLLLAGTAGVIYAAWHPHFVAPQEMATATDLTGVAIALAIVVMLLLGRTAVQFRQPGNSVECVAVELMMILYAGLLLAVTAQLRWVAGAEAGYLAIGSLVVSVKGGDVGAYLAGKSLRGPLLAPILSPRKTWSGAIGGVLASAFLGAAWLVGTSNWFLPGTAPPPLWAALLYSAVLGIVGIGGDLCESLIKRDVDRKDSAPLMPGFGGVLDLLDSLLFAGPVAYLLWLVLPLRPVALDV